MVDAVLCARSDGSVAQPLTKEKTYCRTETHSNRSIISAAGLYSPTLYNRCYRYF